MQRFFLHLHNDIDVPDLEGTLLSDLTEARAFAMGQARELIAASIVEQGRFTLSHRIDVENREGMVLHSVYFKDAVTIEE